MPKLPSGLYACIQFEPIYDLIEKVLNGISLHLPDLMLIHEVEDLRRHVRLLWLLPVGADCAPNFHAASDSNPVPEGFMVVDYGDRMHQVPDRLDKNDEQALEAFWGSPLIQDSLQQQLDKISEVLSSISPVPEDEFLNSWFMPPAIREANDMFLQRVGEEGLI